MAAPQPVYRFAWCLWIKSSPAVRASTTDLPEDAAMATLGAFYTKRIVNDDAELTFELPNVYYGLPTARVGEFLLDNSDLALSSSAEWRLVPVVLLRYDRELDVATTELTGFITRAAFVGSRVRVTLAAYNSALLDELLPAAVLDPAVGSPFEETGAPGAPVPVVFGEDVPVRPPSADVDATSDPPGYDFVVSHGNVYVRSVHQDVDRDTPGLERLGVFADAPGSPTLVSSTKFSVTGDQRRRYLYEAGLGGMPIRFKTTAGGSTFFYSNVKAYDTGASPHEVEIEDALLGAGLNSVQIAGDYLVLRGGYQDVTDGLLPVPGAPGADMTVVRLFDAGDSAPVATADNPLYPIATTHISDVVQAILTNGIWGLSVRSAQAVNAASFAAAGVALGLAGLVGAVRGALAYDGQQRRAGNALDELLMMRGIRLTQNDSLEWVVTVDTQPAAASKTFQLGPGEESGIRIKRILDHGRVDAETAIRNVILHWCPLGRASAAGAKFTSREYAYRSTKAVAAVGRDLSIFNQWIRDQDTAEKVAHYLGEKLQGADERLRFAAGQEARDVALGEVITVSVPSDGISGDWQVHAITRTLSGDVTLSCFRANADAYGAVSGVTTSADPTDIEHRTASGSGTNLIANPDFSGPYRTLGGVVTPHRWAVNALDVAVTLDYSAAVLPDLFGGHYLRCVTTGDATPTGPSSFTISTLDQPCPGGVTLIGSFYCDATEGVFAYVTFSGGGSTTRQAQLVRDPTDVNGLGWARVYFRTHAPTGTQRCLFGIGFSKAGTYQIEAVQLEVAQRTARRPSPWRRHTPQPVTEKAYAALTFTGVNSYTATNLIPAGCKVVGVTARITTPIVFGTATSWGIGVAADEGAWGSGLTITAENAATSAADFSTRNEIYFPTATSVIVKGNGTGTLTSGAVYLTVEYTRPAPPSRP